MTLGISISDHFVVPWQFAESIIRYVTVNPEVSILRAHGSLIHENRAWLLKNCSDKGILMVDTDIVFSPQDIGKLIATALKTGAAVVSGVYKEGYPPHNFALRDLAGNPTPILPMLDPFEVGACGMGFCLIQREAFECSFEPDFAKHVGEDIAFCERVRAKGLKIIADPSVVVEHLRMLPV